MTDIDRLRRMKKVATLRTAERHVRESMFLMRFGFEPVEVIGLAPHVWKRGGDLYTKAMALKEVGR